MSLKDLLKSVGSEPETPGLPNMIGTITKHIVHRETLPRFHRDGWYPSGLHDMCARQHVLQDRLNIAEEEPDFGPGLLRIFGFGHAIHRFYQEDMLGPAGMLIGNWRCSRCHHTVWGLMPKDSCPQCHFTDQGGANLTPEDCTSNCSDDNPFERNDDSTETRGGCVHCGIWGKWEYKEPKLTIKTKGKPIVGRCDGIYPEEPWNPEPYGVLDIKTINSRGFDALLHVKDKDKTQVNIYMHELKLSSGAVLYVNKNTSAEKFYDVPEDKPRVLNILGDTNAVARCLADGDEPLPSRKKCKNLSDKLARKCPVAKECFERS